jgi:hypothetical protein
MRVAQKRIAAASGKGNGFWEIEAKIKEAHA